MGGVVFVYTVIGIEAGRAAPGGWARHDSGRLRAQRDLAE